jgi:mRNA interferase MazF
MVSNRQLQRFDIFWVDLNPTKGSEMQKVRPCVIVSPDELNNLLKTVIVIPLTSTIIDWPFRLKVDVSGRPSSLACDQIRTISKERLSDKIGSLKSSDSKQLGLILKELFA